MSVFGNILSSIFGRSQAQQPQAFSSDIPPPASTAATPQQSAVSGAQSGTPIPPQVIIVDVEVVLDTLQAQKKQKLDWRHSIVDVMKILDLDSSLAARKELAKELGYGGDTNDTATMNTWLHKQVMTKLSENGGKVPESLKH